MVSCENFYLLLFIGNQYSAVNSCTYAAPGVSIAHYLGEVYYSNHPATFASSPCLFKFSSRFIPGQARVGFEASMQLM